MDGFLDIIVLSKWFLKLSREREYESKRHHPSRFVWIARGLSLSKRIRHLEERWAYYFAFGLFILFSGMNFILDIFLTGLPSTVLCNWGSSLANVAFFALLFPFVRIQFFHSCISHPPSLIDIFFLVHHYGDARSSSTYRSL